MVCRDRGGRGRGGGGLRGLRRLSDGITLPVRPRSSWGGERRAPRHIIVCQPGNCITLVSTRKSDMVRTCSLSQRRRETGPCLCFIQHMQLYIRRQPCRARNGPFISRRLALALAVVYAPSSPFSNAVVSDPTSVRQREPNERAVDS